MKFDELLRLIDQAELKPNPVLFQDIRLKVKAIAREFAILEDSIQGYEDMLEAEREIAYREVQRARWE